MCSVENHGVMFSYMYVYMLPTYAHVLFLPLDLGIYFF